jgi:AbrB family looped-hinge helix DNA binding protein
MKQTKVSVRGQTVIPQEIREEFGIKANSRLAWSSRNGVIIVVPIPEDPVEAAFGVLAGRGFTLRDFLEERQKDRELDRRREALLEEQVRRASQEQKA